MHRSSIFYAPSFLGAAILFLLGAELNTTSTSPSLNPLQEQILKKCGNLCDYIDYCINSNHFDDSEFIQGVCDLMVQEVIYLNDEEKVLQIAPRYMRHFHNYELDKHITRPKRSSRKKVQLKYKILSKPTTLIYNKSFSCLIQHWYQILGSTYFWRSNLLFHKYC